MIEKKINILKETVQELRKEIQRAKNVSFFFLFSLFYPLNSQ